MTLTPDGTPTGALGPTCATPEWLFDPRNARHDCTGGPPFAGLHPRGGTVGGTRRHEAVPLLVLGAKLQAKNRRPVGEVHTDRLAHRIDVGVKHDASIGRRTDQRSHQAGDLVALREIVAHPSGNNCCKPAKQASGNLTPRD